MIKFCAVWLCIKYLRIWNIKKLLFCLTGAVRKEWNGFIFHLNFKTSGKQSSGTSGSLSQNFQADSSSRWLQNCNWSIRHLIIDGAQIASPLVSLERGFISSYTRIYRTLSSEILADTIGHCRRFHFGNYRIGPNRILVTPANIHMHPTKVKLNSITIVKEVVGTDWLSW